MSSVLLRLSRRAVQTSRRLIIASYGGRDGSSNFSSSGLALASISLATIATVASCFERDQEGSESRHGIMLSRNFVADAASKASPSVVNIICPQGGIYGSVTAGSGFIISKVYDFSYYVVISSRRMALLRPMHMWLVTPQIVKWWLRRGTKRSLWAKCML